MKKYGRYCEVGDAILMQEKAPEALARRTGAGGNYHDKYSTAGGYTQERGNGVCG